MTDFMDTSLISSEATDLLSSITGQKLNQRDLTPPIIFLANLVTVLIGVMFVDGTVAEEEKHRLLTTLYRFSLQDSDVRRLTHLMIKGVRENQVYKKINDLLKLASPLSISEKLLLISFGYQMSAADGEINLREKKYLEIVAKRLDINPLYLTVLEAAFTHQENVNLSILDEMHLLLNPACFHSLDAVFVKAASDMLASLPTQSKDKAIQQQTIISYGELKKFQEECQKLDAFCCDIFQILQDCSIRGFLPITFSEELSEVSKKLQLQKFRLAVIGEFSQGKSTLLNALLGQELQPVREIPCSGTVTVLKYGTQKRVICRYKNGQEEEIPVEQYQHKATISENAALGCLGDELAHLEIEEIVFEHPDLELCSNGVEIIDSPGLNEHPDRTAITQKLLKDTDAVIFLTNATRSLTQGERDLLLDLKTQLNGGKENEPADNLFVVCNFMDLVRTEKGREQVQQRIERFVKGQAPIVAGNSRVHFISAQAAADAIFTGNENEYLKAFQGFTQSLEKFLTLERGTLKTKRLATEVQRLIQKSLDGLHQAEDTLNGKVKISEAEKLKILEQIGEASGRDVRIRILANQIREQAFEQAVESLGEWYEGLGDRIAEKSQQWYSEHSPVWSQNKLIQDYINQFIRDLSRELDDWGNKQLKDIILQENLEILNTHIDYELDAIKAKFTNLEQLVKTNFSEQLQISIDGITDDFMGLGGIGGGLGIGGALAAGLIVFTGVGLIAVIVTAVAAAIASSFGLGMLDVDGLHNQVKQKVFEIGFEKFDKSIDEVIAKLDEILYSVFDSRVESASRVIVQAIKLYEHLIEQQERVHQETLEQRELEKAWIYQKRQELERMHFGV
ncbi:hypothetical protein NUACC21_26840 [Scytonema sp. NUACC21]